jgi:hypothetical protein
LTDNQNFLRHAFSFPSPRAAGEEKQSRSRDASERPSYENERIVSGEWKSIRTSQFAIRDGTKELKRKMQVVVPAFSSSPSYEKDSEAKRRQTQ